MSEKNRSKPIRLDKYLSDNSALTRSQAKRAIGKKTVRVDDNIVCDPGAKINSYTAKVQVDDIVLCNSDKVYIALYKPSNVVCSHEDAHHQTVFSLLESAAFNSQLRAAHNSQNLQVAGRLDCDTTGLVLITDDGKWNHKITSPRNKQVKSYMVSLEAPLDQEMQKKLREGVLLKGEAKTTLPAEITSLNNDATEVELKICEGKYHQVKRMIAAIGNHVVALHRHSIGGIELGELSCGNWRHLTLKEIAIAQKQDTLS